MAARSARPNISPQKCRGAQWAVHNGRHELSSWLCGLLHGAVISSPLPGLPHGKPAGVPCPCLDTDLRCTPVWQT